MVLDPTRTMRARRFAEVWYLQQFVIRALCSWCVVYGATVLVGWLVAVVAVTKREPAVQAGRQDGRPWADARQ